TSIRPGGQGEQEPDAVEALALVGLFSGISREDLADLAVGARFQKAPPGESIYRAGEAGDRLYVLRAGTVELVTPGGAKTLVRAPGHFGVTSALVGEPRNHSARSVEEADLLALDATTLRAVMLRNPFLAVELAKGLGERPAGGTPT
ncbi:MAG TPA: cyclic nucleotide-binding domain-containing protein, partial [Vicinamibacteria bacterium]|nr:cyclic nucleotide-binding domain-containing protein [Vicinamibacteria bacterium]